MKLLDSLLASSGHGDANGPHKSDCLLTVLDTDIATWPVSKLRDTHRKQDIHIVPADPSKPMPFKASTCEALGINLHQSRQAHGKLFALEVIQVYTNFLNPKQTKEGEFGTMRWKFQKQVCPSSSSFWRRRIPW